MSRSSESFDADRRRILKLVGIAGLTSLGAPALAAAQSKLPPLGYPSLTGAPAVPAEAPAASPVPPKPLGPEKPPEISDDARALAGVIQRRYGRYLSPEQLETVTKEIDGRIQGGRRLRDRKLANGDEPDFTFSA